MPRRFQDAPATAGPARKLDDLSAARGIATGICVGATLWALAGWMVRLALDLV
ncbi:MAG: hypothetical protein U0900_10525 [Myxococcota bacterium]